MPPCRRSVLRPNGRLHRRHRMKRDVLRAARRADHVLRKFGGFDVPAPSQEESRIQRGMRVALAAAQLDQAITDNVLTQLHDATHTQSSPMWITLSTARNERQRMIRTRINDEA